MKKNVCTIFLTLVLACVASMGVAQEKYAVLITGDYAGEGIPPSQQWNEGDKSGNPDFYEFWNDTFLMWEMLVIAKEFKNDNVYVLFANGEDFYFPGMDIRYIASEYYPNIIPPGSMISDGAATISNVTTVFNGLATGSNGYPLVTDNDFLFVWTFDHGSGQNGNSTLHLMDGTMTDDQFAALVNPIQAHKKVFWMQQCYGGGFEDELQGINTVFISASQADEMAHKADDIWDVENEVRNNVTYPHGEFNFHMFSASTGFTPAGSGIYGNEPLSDADMNADGFVSVFESYDWEYNHESIQTETPLYSDLGNIGLSTDLEYPTLLHANIGGGGVTIEKGLIGIHKIFIF